MKMRSRYVDALPSPFRISFLLFAFDPRLSDLISSLAFWLEPSLFSPITYSSLHSTRFPSPLFPSFVSPLPYISFPFVTLALGSPFLLSRTFLHMLCTSSIFSPRLPFSFFPVFSCSTPVNIRSPGRVARNLSKVGLALQSERTAYVTGCDYKGVGLCRNHVVNRRGTWI